MSSKGSTLDANTIIRDNPANNSNSGDEKIYRDYYKKLVINNGGFSNTTNNDAAQLLNSNILIDKSVEDLSWRFKEQYVELQDPKYVNASTQQLARLLTTIDNFSEPISTLHTAKTDHSGVLAFFNMSHDNTIKLPNGGTITAGPNSNNLRASVRIPWNALVVLPLSTDYSMTVGSQIPRVNTRWISANRVNEFLAANTELFKSGDHIFVLPPGIPEDTSVPFKSRQIPYNVRQVATMPSVYELGTYAPLGSDPNNRVDYIKSTGDSYFPALDLLQASTAVYSFGTVDADNNAELIGINIVPWHYSPMIFEWGTVDGVFENILKRPPPPPQTSFDVGNILGRELISYSLV